MIAIDPLIVRLIRGPSPPETPTEIAAFFDTRWIVDSELELVGNLVLTAYALLALVMVRRRTVWDRLAGTRVKRREIRT